MHWNAHSRPRVYSPSIILSTGKRNKAALLSLLAMANGRMSNPSSPFIMDLPTRSCSNT